MGKRFLAIHKKAPINGAFFLNILLNKIMESDFLLRF